jgi:hypothetical protein
MLYFKYNKGRSQIGIDYTLYHRNYKKNFIETSMPNSPEKVANSHIKQVWGLQISAERHIHNSLTTGF